MKRIIQPNRFRFPDLGAGPAGSPRWATPSGSGIQARRAFALRVWDLDVRNWCQKVDGLGKVLARRKPMSQKEMFLIIKERAAERQTVLIL